MTRSFGKRSSSTYWAPRSKRELAVTQSQSPAGFKVVPLQPLMDPATSSTARHESQLDMRLWIAGTSGKEREPKRNALH